MGKIYTTKTIVIATDFSNVSRSVSLYGAEFAKPFKAKVILLNVYKVPLPPPALTITISGYDIMMETQKRLSDEANFLNPSRQIRIRYRCLYNGGKEPASHFYPDTYNLQYIDTSDVI